MSVEYEIKNRHHALGDAIMTAQIWRLYIQLAQEMGFVPLYREVYEYLAKMAKLNFICLKILFNNNKINHIYPFFQSITRLTTIIISPHFPHNSQ